MLRDRGDKAPLFIGELTDDERLYRIIVHEHKGGGYYSYYDIEQNRRHRRCVRADKRERLAGEIRDRGAEGGYHICGGLVDISRALRVEIFNYLRHHGRGCFERRSDGLIEKIGQARDKNADIAYQLYHEQNYEQSYRAVKQHNEKRRCRFAVEVQLFHTQPHERAQKERHKQGDDKRKKCRQRVPDYQDRQAEKYNEIKEIDYKPFLLFNIQQTFLPR